ncbi:MAG: hypothetical protein JWQ09_175 [Segetibacter sp.]|nr:hypothetical protein [Segetibacter sp.]
MQAEDLSVPPGYNLKAVTIRLHPGEDLKVKLGEYVKSLHIKAACLITCVGSLKQVAIRLAAQSATNTIVGKFEIVSLVGTLAETGLHLHISVSDSTGKTVGGHLIEGALVYTTAEVVLGIMDGVSYERETDPTFGYKELIIRKL